jgi:hypothetical protein
MKRILSLLLLLAAFFLVGCQRVSDARAEFCQTLEQVGVQAVEFKTAKVDQPVDELRARVESLQERKATLDRLARLTNIPALDTLSTAVDAVAQSVNEITGNTLGPAVETVNAAGSQLETVYLDLNDAFCAAK